MKNLNPKVKEYLESLEHTQKAESPMFEHGVADSIKRILKKDTEYKPTKQDSAEQAAFDFMEDYPNDDLNWGTYYGPLMVWDGLIYPSIEKIDQEIIEYWTQRARQSKNPLLSSRYADLVVDFSPKVLKTKADPDLFEKVIDSNIIICKKLLAEPTDCKTKIKRALALAVQRNETTRVNEIKDVIIQLEKDIAEDDKPGLWGFSFGWLLLGKFSKKILLSNEEENALLNDIEERFKKNEKNAWLTENIASLLMQYYANKKDEKNLMRVLDVLEISLKTNAQRGSNAILIMHAYQQIHEVYKAYAGGFPESEKASKRLSQEIGLLDLDWDKSLVKVSVKTEIEQEEIENFIKSVFGDDEKRLEVVMLKIAINHLPQKENLIKQFNDASRENPLQFMFTKQLISENGAPPVATLSGVKEDYENNFKHYAMEHTQLGSFFLSLAMNELRKRFDKEQFIEYFAKSAVFENEPKEYLKRAISAYWEEDPLVSSHLFIPLIESGIRNLVKLCGGTFLSSNKLGGYTNLPLGSIFKKNNEIFEDVFSGFEGNVLFYFQLILNEKLGMNLRNDFAHGDNKKNFFHPDVSDRLFHILIFLSMVKEKKKQ